MTQVQRKAFNVYVTMIFTETSVNKVSEWFDHREAKKPMQNDYI